MLAVALGVLVALASASPARIDVRERAPALVAITLPRSAEPSVSATELARAASAAFRAQTGLDLRSADELGLDADLASRCDRGARLSCWLSAVPATRAATSERRGPRRGEVTAIFVVGVVPLGDGRDRITATLVDVARAGACARDTHDGDEVIEDCIWERSAKTEPSVLERSTPDELVAFFTAQLDGALAPLVDDLGERAPFGRVELTTSTGGVDVELDGEPVGTLAAGATILEDVRPGRRTLTLSRSGAAPRVVVVDVRRAETATASAELLAL
ncbi:hypothetical protein L6R52_37335, partial [Myxococcota bacterium]|nr:hypothetical protein [Myxococcota bacterium]